MADTRTITVPRSQRQSLNQLGEKSFLSRADQSDGGREGNRNSHVVCWERLRHRQVLSGARELDPITTALSACWELTVSTGHGAREPCRVSQLADAVPRSQRIPAPAKFLRTCVIVLARLWRLAAGCCIVRDPTCDEAQSSLALRPVRTDLPDAGRGLE